MKMYYSLELCIRNKKLYIDCMAGRFVLLRTRNIFKALNYLYKQYKTN